jgi:hypothetical protein
MPQIYCPNRSSVIFWFSYKGGSKWIEKMYYEYVGGIKDYHHRNVVCKGHWSDLSEPKHILFIRNPYKRIVSGFIFVYAFSNFYRRASRQDPWEIKGESDALTFKKFVDIIYESSSWEEAVNLGVERSHILPQDINKNIYDKRVLDLKIFDKVFDIENIEYNYLDKIFGNSIDKRNLIKNRNSTKYGCYNLNNKNAYELNLLEIFTMKQKPNWRLFFSEEIRFKFETKFCCDLELGKKYGFDYKKSLT